MQCCTNRAPTCLQVARAQMASFFPRLMPEQAILTHADILIKSWDGNLNSGKTETAISRLSSAISLIKCLPQSDKKTLLLANKYSDLAASYFLIQKYLEADAFCSLAIGLLKGLPQTQGVNRKLIDTLGNHRIISIGLGDQRLCLDDAEKMRRLNFSKILEMDDMVVTRLSLAD